ncbi:MAG: ATP-binding SpoIIE family protein phosphatase [Brevinema sp.]
MFFIFSFVLGVLVALIFSYCIYRISHGGFSFDFRLSRTIFRESVTPQNILRLRSRLLRAIPGLIDIRIYVINDDNSISSYPVKQPFTEEMQEEIAQLTQKSLHRMIHISSGYTLSFLPVYTNDFILSKAYEMPTIYRRVLILMVFPPHFGAKINREKAQSASDMLAFLIFLEQSSSSTQKAMGILRENLWESPYPIGICNPKGNLVMGNSSLFELFQGNVPNFSDLSDPKVFLLLLDGKRIGKTFNLRGKKVRLEAYPLVNRNFLVNRCVFMFFDDHLEQQRDLWNDGNTLRRFAVSNPSVGTAMFTSEGILLYSNEAFMNTLHVLKAREAVQKTMFDLFHIQPSEFKEICEQVIINKHIEKNITAIQTDVEFTIRFSSVVFGGNPVVEVVLEQENYLSENVSFLDKETKEIHEELQTARSVQEHILSLPTLYRPGIEVNTFYMPSRQLSGDFFSVIPFGDTHMGFLIADVSGHGVSASLITAALKILIELAPNEPEKLPSIISYFNTYLANILPEGSFVTLFYGILNLSDYSFSYINCGHPFPILEDMELKQTKVLEGVIYPLGGLLNVSYDDQVHTIQMPKKGRILFYTDGLLQHVTGDTKEKLDKIRRLIETNKQAGRQDIINIIYNRMVARNVPFPEDDVSLMMVHFDKNRTKSHTLSISSTLMEADIAITKITGYLQKEANLNPRVYWRIHTAFYEALLNAVVHGNRYNTQRKVQIHYRIFPDIISIRVRDEGIGFNPDTLANPLDEGNVFTQYGRGITMIRTLTDKIKFNRKGNEILLCFLRNPVEKEQ